MKTQFLLILLIIGYCLPLQAQWNYSSDSQAVRIIIDSGGCPPLFYDSNGNEFNNAAIADISDSSNGRIRALHLGYIYMLCGQAHLRKEIGQLTELEEFEMNCNHLTELPEELFTLKKLRSINLSANLFDSIPSGISNLRNLKALSVAYCRNMTKIPEEIGSLDSLEILDLRGNNLVRLPSTIGNLKKLWWLRLHENKLKSLPTELGNCTELLFLELDHNNIISLPHSIGNLFKLSELSIISNQLTELPPEIAKIKNMSRLYLDDNQLKTLPDSIANLDVFCTVAGNRLCNQPESIKTWLDMHAGTDWWKSQINCPNPIFQSKQLHKNTKPDGSVLIEIYDLQGKKFRRIFSRTSLSYSNFPCGVYFLCLKRQGLLETKKIVIER